MTKILLIEDESSVRENIIDLLEAEDYEVIGTENGFLGLIWAFEHSPDLIICDVMMPEVSGHEVLSALRQDPVTASIPYIFLTALSDKADIRRGMELGADDYLTKPYTREELLGAISIRLKRKEMIDNKKVKSNQEPNTSPNLEVLEQAEQYGHQLVPKLQEDMKRAVAKIEVAIGFLSNLETEEQRVRCLAILKDVCSHDLNLIQKMDVDKELLSCLNKVAKFSK